MASSGRPLVSSPKQNTTTTATRATAPTRLYTATTPPAASSSGISDGPTTPDMRRPTPSVRQVPVARIGVGELSPGQTLTARAAPTPKNDIRPPTSSTGTAPRTKPKASAATAAISPNAMITGRRPQRSTTQASSSLPGIDTPTMTAVNTNAEVRVKPIDATTVGMNVWIE